MYRHAGVICLSLYTGESLNRKVHFHSARLSQSATATAATSIVYVCGSCYSWTSSNDHRSSSPCPSASSGPSQTAPESVQQALRPSDRLQSAQATYPSLACPVRPWPSHGRRTCRKTLARRHRGARIAQCSCHLSSWVGCCLVCSCDYYRWNLSSSPELWSWKTRSHIRCDARSMAFEKCHGLREAADVPLRREQRLETEDSKKQLDRAVPFTLTHRLQHPWSQVDEPRSDQGALNARVERSDGIVHQPV